MATPSPLFPCVHSPVPASPAPSPSCPATGWAPLLLPLPSACPTPHLEQFIPGLHGKPTCPRTLLSPRGSHGHAPPCLLPGGLQTSRPSTAVSFRSPHPSTMQAPSARESTCYCLEMLPLCPGLGDRKPQGPSSWQAPVDGRSRCSNWRPYMCSHNGHQGRGPPLPTALKLPPQGAHRSLESLAEAGWAGGAVPTAQTQACEAPARRH